MFGSEDDLCLLGYFGLEYIRYWLVNFPGSTVKFKVHFGSGVVGDPKIIQGCRW